MITRLITIQLGADYAGLTIYGQLYDDENVATGDPITDFEEISNGIYTMIYTVEEDFRGTIQIYNDDGDAFLTALAINPDVGGSSGAITVTLTTELEDETALDGVSTWITTDADGEKIVAGTFVSDTFGETIYKLDAGVFYVHLKKTGYNFATNPERITVSVSSKDFTFTATEASDDDVFVLCLPTDLEKAYGTDKVASWVDMDGDADDDEIYDRLYTLCLIVSERVQKHLGFEYTTTSRVPNTVKRAAIMLTSYMFKKDATLMTGMLKETLEGYSYEKGKGDIDMYAIPHEIALMLSPYRLFSRPVVYSSTSEIWI